LAAILRTLAAALAALLLAGPALAGPEARVALLPIAVYASGADSEYLQSGLAEMLSARLEQYEGIQVLRPEGAVAPAAAREDALARGREAGADFVLYGSFTRFGKGASLDLRCDQVLPAATGGEGADAPPARRVFIQAGTLAEIIPDLDTLAEKVARFAISGSGKPALLGEADAAPGAAAASAAPTAAQYQELLRRLDAVERALYQPVAQGEPPTAPQATPDAASSVVR
jgi:TolB-like protein